MPVQITEFTYATAIQEICKLVGHPKPIDPAGATDSAVQQMGAAVNFALDELLTMHEWQDLTVKASLAIVADSAGQKEKGFALPADFKRFIDQTQWNNASLWPAGGPVSPQGWMAYLVQNYVPQMTFYWQMRGDLLYVLNPPFPTPGSFEYMYLSTAQVIDADDATVLKNRATKNGDTFKLDSFMVMLLGRFRYLEWKGFDSSAAGRDFLTIFAARSGGDKGAEVLSLSRQRNVPLIGEQNIPETGFGL